MPDIHHKGFDLDKVRLSNGENLPGESLQSPFLCCCEKKLGGKQAEMVFFQDVPGSGK